MGDSFAGKSSRRYTASPRSIMVKKHNDIHQPKAVGLHCFETWKLPDCKEDLRRSKVRDKGKELCDTSNRCTYLDKVTPDEERGIVRVSSKIDAGRKKFRRLGRSSSRYDCSELKQASKIRTISDLKEEETRFKRAQEVAAFRYLQLGLGFSDPGDLDEQQSTSWIPQTFQTEAALGVGMFQSWQDFDDNELGQVLSDLLDSDGCESSG